MTCRWTRTTRTTCAASAPWLSPDGTRVFVGKNHAIEVYLRDAATGTLTFQDCIADGRAGIAARFASVCDRADPYAISGQQDSTGNVLWLAVSPDGTSLYSATDKRLTQFTIAQTVPTLHTGGCVMSAGEALLGGSPCDTVPADIDDTEFSSLKAPVVTADGTDVYVAITGPGDPTAGPFRGAVLQFARASNGALTYQNCAGTLIGYRPEPAPVNVSLHAVNCGDGGLDLRRVNGLAVSPDGNSVYVTGAASDDAFTYTGLARLAKAGGALTFDSCRIVPTGTPCLAGEGADRTGAADDIAVSPDSLDVYVNSRPAAAHLRLVDGTLTLLNDITGPDERVAFLAGRRYGFDPTGTRLFSPSDGSGATLNVFARNPATGALSFSGCGQSASNLGNVYCEGIINGYGGSHIAVAPLTGAMVTYGLVQVPSAASSFYGAMLASFQRGQTLTVATPTNGTVTGSPTLSCATNCTATVLTGASISISASPSANYVFEGWGGDCAGFGTTNPCSLVMDASKTASALFGKVKVILTVTTTAGGAVSSSPAGLTCGASETCTASFDIGSIVQLTPAPSAGYRFSGWSSESAYCDSTTAEGVCTVSMPYAKSLVASFAVVTDPPAAPSSLNAVVTSTTVKVGKKSVTTYSGLLTWQDNSTNEDTFVISRYKSAKGKCSPESAFSVQVGANISTFTDSTATGSTCGYAVAATNAFGTSLPVRDLNKGTGVTP